jgi:hypothetical protein
MSWEFSTFVMNVDEAGSSDWEDDTLIPMIISQRPRPPLIAEFLIFVRIITK